MPKTIAARITRSQTRSTPPATTANTNAESKNVDQLNQTLRYLLSVRNLETIGWKPSDTKTLDLLRARSGSPRKNGWSHAELADLIIKLVEENNNEKEKKGIFLTFDEKACLDIEIQEGIDHMRTAGVAFAEVAQLQRQIGELNEMVASLEDDLDNVETFGEDLYELQDENEALQSRVEEMEGRDKEILESERKRNRVNARLEKELKEVKATLETEREAFKLYIKKDQAEIESKASLEQHWSEMKFKLEQERDQEKAKLSSLKRKLAAMLAA
jgi:DNA repair exonuclease SbcCD ATPase subunit